ncbi:MAG: DHH family phosphoesterase [Clostridia bacterium]|nr:DHH family phosphoesterase [Clostridia bacterium]
MAQRVTIEALAGWLKQQDDLVLLGHVNPDGDAVGSALAIRHALVALGRRATVCLPGGIPKMYGWMPGAATVLDTCDQMPFAPAAALAVDVSDESRLGEAGRALFESCSENAAIDHHATNAGFGGRYALDGGAAAVGELALELISALGVPMTREIAECLFVAISTDCGQFNYSNTRPQTMTAAARCIAAGIDVADITRRLYRTRSYGRTKLLGLVLSELEVSDDGRLAWARLTEDMLLQARALREDNEGIVNYLLEIEGVCVAVLAEQRGTDTKLSLRSAPPVDVARDIAMPLGGGGHARAAGATLQADMDTALGQALALARKALDDA